jgi:hypothetical protein
MTRIWKPLIGCFTISMCIVRHASRDVAPLRRGRAKAQIASISCGSAGEAYTVINGGAPTTYTIEKHALWCLFLDGKALPIGGK